MKELFLASTSPARKQLLEQLGVPFKVVPSYFEEDMAQELPPEQLAVKLSQGKAREVARRLSHGVVLAADSFAVFNGQFLGKPHTRQRAIDMLTTLSGQSHDFITGYTLLDVKNRRAFSEHAVTRVQFKELGQSAIENYVRKENVLQKAGAYSIQGLGAVLVERIEGDYNNVVGLPLASVAQHLPDFGIEVL